MIKRSFIYEYSTTARLQGAAYDVSLTFKI